MLRFSPDCDVVATEQRIPHPAVLHSNRPQSFRQEEHGLHEQEMALKFSLQLRLPILRNL